MVESIEWSELKKQASGGKRERLVGAEGVGGEAERAARAADRGRDDVAVREALLRRELQRQPFLPSAAFASV